MNNNRINQITASLSNLGTKPDTLYSHQEIVDLLIELQSAMAKGVFEKTHAENLRDRDIMVHFEALAKEYGLDQTDIFCRFKQNMQELGYIIGSYINGLRGEQSVRRALKLLSFDRGVKILYNVRLEDDDSEAEYDAIVITPYGLFVLEVKNWGASVTITQDGFLKRNGNNDVIYDLAGRMSSKQALLVEYLGDRFPNNYHNILVFPNEKVSVENYYDGFPVICGGGISYKIRGFAKGEDLMTEEQVESIKQAILSHSSEMKEYSPVNCEVIVADYAALMASIEEASTVARNEDEDSIHAVEQAAPQKEGNTSGPDDIIRPRVLPHKKALDCAAAAAVAVSAILGGLWYVKKNF